MLDTRKRPRRRVLKEGRVVLNAGCSVINCIIRDCSDSGAKLRLPAATELPGKFELLFLADGILYPARLVWRHNDDLGVEFVGEPRRAPPRKW